MHPVFHLSLLKKFVGTRMKSSPTSPPTDANGQFSVEPEAIMGRRITNKHDRPVTQLLIHCRFSAPEDATWKDISAIQQ